MSSTYTPFSKIELSHGFCGEGNINFLSIQPTPETAAYLKQAEILGKQDSEGLQLFHSDNSAALLPTLPAKKKLTFFLLTNDPFFWGVTDINALSPGTEQYWFVFDEEDSSANVLLEEVVVSKPDPAESAEEDSIPERSFLEGAPTNLVGVIEIGFDSSEGLAKRNFGIRFEARDVYWCYKFINSSDVNLALCQVTSSQKDIQFSALRAKKNDNGGSTFESTSLAPIPMSQRFTFSNRLEGEGLGIDSKIPLPTVDPQMVIKDDDGKYVVNLFVYL